VTAEPNDAGQAAEIEDTGPGGRVPEDGNLDLVLDISLRAVARLGEVEMPISEILKLGPGSVIEINRLVEDPIDLLVNDKLVARGEVVTIDEKFALRVTEIISREDRIKSLS
jgi:flagellar motor switch protein FliN/FliY